MLAVAASGAVSTVWSWEQRLLCATSESSDVFLGVTMSKPDSSLPLSSSSPQCCWLKCSTGDLLFGGSTLDTLQPVSVGDVVRFTLDCKEGTLSIAVSKRCLVFWDWSRMEVPVCVCLACCAGDSARFRRCVVECVRGCAEALVSRRNL